MIKAFLDRDLNGVGALRKRAGDAVDFAGRAGRFLASLRHFVGDDREAADPASPARAASMAAFQCQQVGLVSDVADFLGHIGNRHGTIDEFADRAGDCP